MYNLFPASKIKKTQHHSALKKKTEKIAAPIKRKLESSFNENVSLHEKNKTTSKALSVQSENLTEKLKEMCMTATKEEKVKVISLVPSSWSKQKICEEINITQYLIRVLGT